MCGAIHPVFLPFSIMVPTSLLSHAASRGIVAAMREVFDLLFRVQRRAGLDLMVIGGWAVQAHGYSRNTLDVDCMTAVENEAALGMELIKAGFECFEEKPAFRRYRHKLDSLMLLDVMRVNADTFRRMWDVSQSIDLSGIALRIPSLAHLIALKLHAAQNEHRTQKDMADIVQLLTANPGRIPPSDLRQLCDKFGTPTLTGQLHAFL